MNKLRGIISVCAIRMIFLKLSLPATFWDYVWTMSVHPERHADQIVHHAGEALATLVVNKLRGIISMCAIKAPTWGC